MAYISPVIWQNKTGHVWWNIDDPFWGYPDLMPLFPIPRPQRRHCSTLLLKHWNWLWFQDTWRLKPRWPNLWDFDLESGVVKCQLCLNQLLFWLTMTQLPFGSAKNTATNESLPGPCSLIQLKQPWLPNIGSTGKFRSAEHCISRRSRLSFHPSQRKLNKLFETNPTCIWYMRLRSTNVTRKLSSWIFVNWTNWHNRATCRHLHGVEISSYQIKHHKTIFVLRGSNDSTWRRWVVCCCSCSISCWSQIDGFQPHPWQVSHYWKRRRSKMINYVLLSHRISIL